MRLRELRVGCFGGGTGLPSLLGGLKTNPWIHADAVVTMFDSGGSSGVLRDELGVLPPGDILKCALALARNSKEARRVLLARLPMLEHARLGGHTGGNLLLSMMQRYSGDFLDAIDGLRALLGCRGRGRSDRGGDQAPDRGRRPQHEVAQLEGAQSVRARAQGASAGRHAAQPLLGRGWGVLVRRYRPPRSPAAGLRRLDRARAAAARGRLSAGLRAAGVGLWGQPKAKS